MSQAFHLPYQTVSIKFHLQAQLLVLYLTVYIIFSRSMQIHPQTVNKLPQQDRQKLRAYAKLSLFLCYSNLNSERKYSIIDTAVLVTT